MAAADRRPALSRSPATTAAIPASRSPPPHPPQVYADGLYGAPKNYTLALRYFWHFMAMTGGWKESGKVAADRVAGETAGCRAHAGDVRACVFGREGPGCAACHAHQLGAVRAAQVAVCPR